MFYGVSFKDSVDKQICKLILDEMKEANRSIKNAPGISKSFEGEPLPGLLIEKFPALKDNRPKLENGFIGISLHKTNHFRGEMQNVCHLLSSMR